MDSQHSRASDAPQTRTAPPPFDKLDADIVLRSSDHVDFRVRRHILYEASPVFESILSIPPHRGEDSCPVVDLTEDHQTLRTLLLICYPVSRKKRQPSQSLPQLEAAIAAAQKYDMELPLEVLVHELLQPCAYWQSIEVWGAACRLQLEDVASRAAGWVSMLPLRLGKPDVRSLGRMDGISAGNYYRLRLTCKQQQLDPKAPLLEPSKTNMSDREVEALATTHPWFRSMMPYPDLECRSADGGAFLVHKCILAMASTVLAARIEAIQPPTSSQHETGGAICSSLSSLSLEEDASVLSGLFSLFYPGEHELSLSPSHCVAVRLAAKKYAADAAVDKATQHWEVVAKAAPLLSYLVSSRADVRAYARVAARYTLSSPLDDVYHPEMESSPALSYHHLLTYHEHCRKLVKKMILGEFPESSAQPGPTSRKNKDNEAYNHLSQVDESEESLRRKAARAERFGISVSEPVVKRSNAPTKRYAWLYDYVEELVLKALVTHPTRVMSDVSVFEAAMAAGHWDGTSDPFLSNLIRVNAVVSSVAARLNEVILEF